MEILNELSELVQKGKMEEVGETVTKALKDGISPADILNKGLICGLGTVGEKFQNGEIFLPEMIIAGRAMIKALEILEPEMVKGDVKAKGTIIIGTVKADLHDIGKNLVGMMFKGAGYKVIDLGTDISAERFIDAIKEHNPDLVGLSALLTTTMVHMKDIVTAIKESRLDVKVLVGGAPVSENFAKEISADGYASDAAAAVDMAKMLVA